MIEYLLMLMLTVAVIAGLNRALGEPLQRYTRNYVGDMVRCVVETGELPRRALEICGITIRISLEEFTVETNTAGGDYTTEQYKQRNSRGSGDQSDAESGDRNSNNTARGRNRSSPRRFSSRPQRSSTSIDNNSIATQQANQPKAVSDDVVGSAGDDEFDGTGPDGNRIIRIRRRRAEGISGTFSVSGQASAKKEEELKPAPLNVKRSLTSKDNLGEREPQGPQPFKMEVEKKRKTASVKDDEGLSFSFGKLLKWGIIIVILIVFGVFMFNQLNSIRKGWTS